MQKTSKCLTDLAEKMRIDLQEMYFGNTTEYLKNIGWAIKVTAWNWTVPLNIDLQGEEKHWKSIIGSVFAMKKVFTKQLHNEN